MNILNENTPDIEWSVASLNGIPILCLQTEGPSMSAGMACFETSQDIQFRVLSELGAPGKPTFALFNGKPSEGAPIILEAPFNSLAKPVLEAAENAEMWVFCLQYLSQGTRLSRYWIIKDQSSEERGPFNHWIVQIERIKT